jgi:hypothetical protein
MKKEPAFLRLLRDYERLCVDEATALREVNLAALARLQNQKSVVGQAIATCPSECGPGQSKERLENVIATQEQNLVLAQEQMAAIERERQNLTSANQRLESLGKAYKRKVTRPSKLEANG